MRDSAFCEMFYERLKWPVKSAKEDIQDKLGQRDVLPRKMSFW